MRESTALHSSLAPVMVTAIQDRACGVHGCPFFFLAPSSLLSFRSRLLAFFFFFFSRGIWRFSRLSLLGWLALRRRPGAPCLLGASGGQLQRPLLLFLLPFLFFLSCPFFSSSFFTLCRKKNRNAGKAVSWAHKRMQRRKKRTSGLTSRLRLLPSSRPKHQAKPRLRTEETQMPKWTQASTKRLKSYALRRSIFSRHPIFYSINVGGASAVSRRFTRLRCI